MKNLLPDAVGAAGMLLIVVAIFAGVGLAFGAFIRATCWASGLC